MIEIGKKIKISLREKGISINSLAEQTGYTRQGLSVALKTGDFKISILQKIASVLGVDICEFFQGSKENDFKKEMLYFIRGLNPVYYERNIYNIDTDDLHSRDFFMQRSLENIYIDFIFKNSLDFLNKKYNRDIKILSIIEDDISEPKEYSIACVENNIYIYGKVTGKHFLDDILKDFYESIDDDDISFIKSQTNRSRRDFLVFIENSIFVDWYKKSFNIKDHLMKSILMDISSRIPIILDHE